MRRFRKLLKYFALCVAALVAVALVVNFVLNVIANRRLEAKIAALKSAGQPTSLADLARPAIPPEKNAATYLRRAQAGIEALEIELSAALDAAPQADQDRVSNEGRLSPTLTETYQAAFAGFPQVIPLIEQAAACPKHDSELDLTADASALQEAVLKRIVFYRATSRVLLGYLDLQISHGERDAAMRTAITMLRLGRHYDQEPLITNYLVAIACRGVGVYAASAVLRDGPLAGESHMALEAELAKHETFENVHHAVSTERAQGLQIFRELDGEVFAGPIRLPWLKNNACNYLDELASFEAEVDQSYVQSRDAMNAMAANSNRGPLTINTALKVSLEATYRSRSQLRALRVLNALTEKPESIDPAKPDLAKLNLPAEATTDPYVDRPLLVKKIDGQWLIYAVGSNLQDDGGKVDDMITDIGLGPPKKPFPPNDSAR